MQIVLNIIVLIWLLDLSCKYERLNSIMPELDQLIKNIIKLLGGKSGNTNKKC